METRNTRVHDRRPVGELLRRWRGFRRMSQMELALETGISPRHLSFVENGRSAPGRDLVLRLAECLELPLRERNDLLLAAGYAPIFSEVSLESPDMYAVRAAVRKVLVGHEPYPAVVVDRAWNLVDMNDGASLFTDGLAPNLLVPPVNVLRLSLHPEGLAKRIINLEEWRQHLLERLRRQVELSADAGLSELLSELLTYPSGEPAHAHTSEIVAPLRIRHGGNELSFFGTVTTFGTPTDVTVSELAIESFFPADDSTAAYLLRKH